MTTQDSTLGRLRMRIPKAQYHRTGGDDTGFFSCQPCVVLYTSVDVLKQHVDMDRLGLHTGRAMPQPAGPFLHHFAPEREMNSCRATWL
jgi:hypothetical protein